MPSKQDKKKPEGPKKKKEGTTSPIAEKATMAIPVPDDHKTKRNPIPAGASLAKAPFAKKAADDAKVIDPEIMEAPATKPPMNMPPRPVSDADGNRELTEDEITLMAKQMGIPRTELAGKVIKMSPQFIQQMKEGKVSFQQKRSPDLPQQIAPNGFRPPTPRNAIEQRYAGVLKRSMAMRKTNKLPASTTGHAVSPRDVTTGDASGRPLTSVFLEMSTRNIGSPSQKRMVLGIRPPRAPSILEECKPPIKLMISQHQSPGDVLMLSRAVDDLHKSYPGMFRTRMRTPANDIWQHNPNNDLELKDDDPEVMWVQAEYKLINTANKGAHHFSHGFRKDLESKLGLPIDQTSPYGAIHVSDQEKTWFSQIWELGEKNVAYWIVDAGRKSDYTAKHWEVTRFQELIDRTPDITWVQIGADTDKKNPHFHPELKGDNVVNLVGKTTIRQLIRLVYHSAGIVTPVSFPMHLATAVPVHPRFRRATRPCVVIAGGREPSTWEAYSTHQFLHTCGMLPCCSHGGCWKSRVMPLGDGDDKDYNEVIESPSGQKSIITRLCEMPVVGESGQIIPKCLDMITTDMVVNAVQGYLTEYDYSDDDDLKWKSKWPYEKPAEAMAGIEDVIAKTASGEIVRKNTMTNSAAQPKEEAPAPAPVREALEKDHAPEPDTKGEEVEQEAAENPETFRALTVDKDPVEKVGGPEHVKEES